MQLPPFFATIEWTPIKIGVLGVGSVVLLLLLFGIIKCAQIMRRPTASKLCASSLMVLLIGFFAAAFGITLGMSADEFLTGNTKGVVGTIGVLILFLALLPVVVALILAVVGLTTFNRIRFSQGRGMAGWTVGLGAALLLAFMVLVVVAMVESIQEDKTPGRAAPKGARSATFEEP